jgi:hypothetical protein
MSSDSNIEPFEPTDELLKELKNMNGIIETRGGRREGAGAKKKDGSDPKPIKKAKPKLKELPKRNEDLVHDVNGLLSDGAASGGRGKLTLQEMTKNLPAKLVELGLDPVAYISQMINNPEQFGLEGKDVLGALFKLTDKIHASKKAIEVTEEHTWRLEVVKRDFEVDDAGEVVDV